MSLTIFLSMFLFSLVMSISPGPVNMMIVTSSINNGFKNTFAFISGATIGFTLLLISIGFGLSKILNIYPSFLSYLEFFGFSFIIYMGYKIATSASSLEIKNENKRNLRFYEGFLLQWLNPKAWIASLSGISMFSGNEKLLIFVVIYFIVCYLSLSFWGYLGLYFTKFLNTHNKLKLFNLIMGSILILSAIFMLLSNLLQ
uniref:LysE family translocator n=1 Tax=Aliarcobacter sp. TaxID=2321116 RepID=UPI004048921E